MNLVDIHASLSGEKKNIVIPVVYLDFVEGDYVAAVVLREVVGLSSHYSKQGNRDGWFYRTEEHWKEHARLSRKQVNRAIGVINRIAGIKLKLEVDPENPGTQLVQKDVRKAITSDGSAMNSTATFYRINHELFGKAFNPEKSGHSGNSPMGNSQNGNGPDGSSRNVPSGNSGNSPNGNSLNKESLLNSQLNSQEKTVSDETDGDAVGAMDSSNANQPEENDQGGTQPVTPYALTWAVFREVGIDLARLPRSSKEKQLAVAKRLIADDMSIDEGVAITQWLLRDDFWRSKGIDMFVIESNRMKYMAASAAQSRPKPVAPDGSGEGVTIAGTWIPQGIVNKARSTFQWFDVLYDGGIRHVTKEQVERMIAGEKVKDVIDPETAKWLNNKLAQHILQVDAISRI